MPQLPAHQTAPMPSIGELTLADEPARWQALGFAVTEGCCQLADVRVRLAGSQAGTGIIGCSLRDLASAELDGLPTTISGHSEQQPAPAHANGVLAIDHIVAMTPNFKRSLAALQSAGLDLRRVREEPTPAGAPRQAFFRLGQEILELVQIPDEAVERAGGPDGPARFWGLALLVEDLDHTVERLGEHAGEARPAVQPGRRIATVRRSAGLSVPVALMSRDDRAAVAR